MMFICMDDMIMKRAKYEQIAVDTKAITNTILYTGLGVAIGAGVIGLPIVGNYMIIIGVNKIVRIVIKKTGVINKVKGFIKSKRVEAAI